MEGSVRDFVAIHLFEYFDFDVDTRINLLLAFPEIFKNQQTQVVVHGVCKYLSREDTISLLCACNRRLDAFVKAMGNKLNKYELGTFDNALYNVDGFIRNVYSMERRDIEDGHRWIQKNISRSSVQCSAEEYDEVYNRLLDEEKKELEAYDAEMSPFLKMRGKWDLE